MSNIEYGNMVAFFDIETSKIDCHDEEGFELKNPIPQVYLCSVVLIKKEDLNKVNKDNIQIIRNSLEKEDMNKIQCYTYFFRTLKQFIDFTKKLKNKTICYVHNLSYELSFLIREVDNGLDDEYQNIFRGKNDCIRAYLKDIPNVEFRDSLSLLRKSIKVLGDEIGYPKLEIDYEKNLHYYNELFDNDYNYNERDNIITLLSIADFLQHKAPVIGVTSVDKLPITSTRYIKDKRYQFAKKYFNKELNSTARVNRNNSLDDNLDFYEICKNAFRGGLVSCNPLYMPNDNGNVWLENSAYHIDITSSYIYVMLNSKFPYFSKSKNTVIVKNKEKATNIMKALIYGIEKKGSEYMNNYGIDLLIDGEKKGIKGFYANVKFKNIKIRDKYDIPSIDSARTSVAIDKDSKDLKRFCGKVLEADELSMSLNDATTEAILLDYYYEDIECDYIIYTTESKHLPYFELCFLINEFFTKQSLKPYKNDSKINKINYDLSKSGLNGMYGIKVQDLIKDTFDVVDNQVTVSNKAHSNKDSNNKELFNKYVENTRNKKTDIYSDVVYITTKARLNLIKMKKFLNVKGCSCIYCDTDSLIFEIFGNSEEILNGIEKYNEKIKKDLLKNKWIKEAIKKLSEINNIEYKEIEKSLEVLGSWDYESVDENDNIKPYDFFSTLGPKKYCKCKNGKVETTISGLSKEIGKLIEKYAKQENISLLESAKLIFKDKTTFDETCSGQTNTIPTTFSKEFIDSLRDENNMPMKGYGGNLIVNVSFNLSVLSDTESLLHSEFGFFENKKLTEQTVSIEKGIIKII